MVFISGSLINRISGSEIGQNVGVGVFEVKFLEPSPHGRPGKSLVPFLLLQK